MTSVPDSGASAAAADFILSKIDGEVRVAVILGSGLGRIAETVAGPTVFEHCSIPGFPCLTAPGHAGQLVVGRISGTGAALMSGRPHLYEGLDRAAVTFPVRVFRRLGARTLILTNAAGAVNRSFSAGNLMLITDHIDLTFYSARSGRRPEALVFRRESHYDSTLMRLAGDEASQLGIELRAGIYAGMTGPNYETDAEMTMLERIGADAVGMSTVAEAVEARKMGMAVLGISCIANARRRKTKLTHGEVQNVVGEMAPPLGRLIAATVRRGQR